MSMDKCWCFELPVFTESAVLSDLASFEGTTRELVTAVMESFDRARDDQLYTAVHALLKCFDNSMDTWMRRVSLDFLYNVGRQGFAANLMDQNAVARIVALGRSEMATTNNTLVVLSCLSAMCPMAACNANRETNQFRMQGGCAFVCEVDRAYAKSKIARKLVSNIKNGNAKFEAGNQHAIAKAERCASQLCQEEDARKNKTAKKRSLKLIKLDPPTHVLTEHIFAEMESLEEPEVALASPTRNMLRIDSMQELVLSCVCEAIGDRSIVEDFLPRFLQLYQCID
jgi:hypothetical protein